MREGVTLRCEVCKHENYRKSRLKQNNNQIRLDINKYCPNCKKHTLHKEKKSK